MTTTFVPFTEIRKQFIDHMRNRVMTERPVREWRGFAGMKYLHVERPLGLVDYAVYAALRGADYRKGDHTGGRVATQALSSVVRSIKTYGNTGRSGILPPGSTSEQVDEFVAVLEAELAKWKDAPTMS